MAHPGIDVIRTLLGETRNEARDVLQRRADLAALAGSPPPPDGVAVTTMTLAGRRAERLVPADAAADEGPTILYLHGGGYVSGSIDTHRGVAGALALAAGLPVVTLDYRLGPEDPFPAALDDAVGAFDELGDRPIAIVGDSAGGGLALATSVRLRDRGGATPFALALFSPWVDLTQTAGSMTEREAIDPMVSATTLQLMADAYLGGADPEDPGASPLFADLAGLPPMRIDVGTDEVLHDDSTRLAERAAAAGVPVELQVWPDMIHVFQAFPAELVPEAAASIAAAAAFVRAAA